VGGESVKGRITGGDAMSDNRYRLLNRNRLTPRDLGFLLLDTVLMPKNSAAAINGM